MTYCFRSLLLLLFYVLILEESKKLRAPIRLYFDWCFSFFYSQTRLLTSSKNTPLHAHVFMTTRIIIIIRRSHTRILRKIKQKSRYEQSKSNNKCFVYDGVVIVKFNNNKRKSTYSFQFCLTSAFQMIIKSSLRFWASSLSD